MTIPPFVVLERVESRSAIWVCAQKGVDYFFERAGVETLGFSFFMERPKFSEVSLSDVFVDPIVRAGAEEGRAAVVHDKKDNSSGKHICLYSGILSLFHFRRPVAFSAHSRPKFVISLISFGVPGEAEVRYFDIEMRIQENIFRLDISVGDISLD